jgi:hypothetical protein
MNFLNALEKIPGLIRQEQKKISEIEKDVPILEEVVNSVRTKENALGELKNELVAMDRKIQLSITPEQQVQDPEQKPQEDQTSQALQKLKIC